jgi:phage-related protein
MMGRALYIQLDIIDPCGLVCFLGDSLRCLRDFPQDVRHDAGYQIEKVQRGEQPDDFKPVPAIGKGVEEIRVSNSSGAYRVIYLARRTEAVYVLHAFQKRLRPHQKRTCKSQRYGSGKYWEEHYEKTGKLREHLGRYRRHARSSRESARTGGAHA